MGGPIVLGRPGGGEPDRFLDDVDRAYVVAQLEGRLEEPVALRVVRDRASPLLVPGPLGAPADPAEHRRAERLAREVAALVPAVTVEVDERAGDPLTPRLALGGPAGGRVRFVGVPRVNLFRLLLEAVRRASTRDWDLPPDRLRSLGRLPAPVRLLAFATPT
jgi:hypothetical protein